MTIKHISFDVWNTLITANPNYADMRAWTIAKYGDITEVEARAAYKKIKKELDNAALQGTAECAAYAWERLGYELGITPLKSAKLRFECEQWFLKFPPHVAVDLPMHLLYLSGRYDLSIKSNTNFISGDILRRACKFESWNCFEFTHFSDEALLCKPDPRFFARTLTYSPIPLLGQEVLHVGDSEEYDGKCVDLGFNFCHIKNPNDLLDKLAKGELVNA